MACPWTRNPGTRGEGWSHPVYTVTPGVPGDLSHELGYAQQHGPLAGLRLVPGTEPFSPAL